VQLEKVTIINAFCLLRLSFLLLTVTYCHFLLIINHYFAYVMQWNFSHFHVADSQRIEWTRLYQLYIHQCLTICFRFALFLQYKLLQFEMMSTQMQHVSKLLTPVQFQGVGMNQMSEQIFQVHPGRRGDCWSGSKLMHQEKQAMKSSFRWLSR